MDRIKQLLAAPEPRTWIFFGDSITHGALHTYGRRDYVELFEERVRYELRRTTDIVIKSAVNGYMTTNLLETFDWRVKRFSPDVVFLMIGMNDCRNRGVALEQFAANIDVLAERVIGLGAVPVMQTTCPILRGGSLEREPHFDDYMQAIRDVAARRELPLIDHTSHWRANPGKHVSWMDDAFHPNAFGHLAFAKLIFEQLGIAEQPGYTPRLFLPL